MLPTEQTQEPATVVVEVAAAEVPPVPVEPEREEVTAAEVIEEEEPRDSLEVSQSLYDQTLVEVRHFIGGLNAIITKKDYNGWKQALSDEFFKKISLPEFLLATSGSAVLKSRRVRLRTPNDYFMQVVVPSRSNSKVDAIEFVDTDRVKVYYEEVRVRNNVPERRRLRLYELIKTGGTWKIID